MHVSHRCHNMRCVNPEHMSFEPSHVNMERQICRAIFPVACKTHTPYQDCLPKNGTDNKNNTIHIQMFKIYTESACKGS